MHRKSHLDERLASCSDILKCADLGNKNMKEAVESKEYFDLGEVFGNDNPVRLEIGCGKGKFVCETAQREENINFVAVEKISNVIIDACEKAKALALKNVMFFNCAAEVLPRYFKDGSFEVIYLNFSNPLPKLGYAKQRLTHPKFLEAYKKLLTDNGEIRQKTDNKDFYIFSLESFKECGFKIVETCEDLKNSGIVGNVETEHEKKFSEQGLPIYFIRAVK